MGNCGFGFGNRNKNNNTSENNYLHPDKKNIYHDVEAEIDKKNGEKKADSEKKNGEKKNDTPEKIEGLLGVAKSDVFLTTSVIFSYTVEVNYKTYNYTEN
jgi:hypothetical protein